MINFKAHYTYLNSLLSSPPPGDIYLSPGNFKVDAPIYNLPSMITCRPDAKCPPFCYTLRSERRFPGVLPSRVRNLFFSKLPNFAEEMVARIFMLKKKSEYFRIHEGGDFYSTKYINKWYDIIKECNWLKFYTYTKRHDLFTTKLLREKPKNLQLIYSFDVIDQFPDKTPFLDKGFDKVAYISSRHSTCPAQKQEDTMCMRDCPKCARSSAKVILFYKH